mmetsp:Transcript_10852/g.44438  ORF Transcript_10852/g.44438 Transcript_10852/m.44438 type:complete len:215 (-) Transcript_10852:315-959(-)
MRCQLLVSKTEPSLLVSCCNENVEDVGVWRLGALALVLKLRTLLLHHMQHRAVEKHDILPCRQVLRRREVSCNRNEGVDDCVLGDDMAECAVQALAECASVGVTESIEGDAEAGVTDDVQSDLVEELAHVPQLPLCLPVQLCAVCPFYELQHHVCLALELAHQLLEHCPLEGGVDELSVDCVRLVVLRDEAVAECHAKEVVAGHFLGVVPRIRH